MSFWRWQILFVHPDSFLLLFHQVNTTTTITTVTAITTTVITTTMTTMTTTITTTTTTGTTEPPYSSQDLIIMLLQGERVFPIPVVDLPLQIWSQPLSSVPAGQTAKPEHKAPSFSVPSAWCWIPPSDLCKLLLHKKTILKFIILCLFSCFLFCNQFYLFIFSSSSIAKVPKFSSWKPAEIGMGFLNKTIQKKL